MLRAIVRATLGLVNGVAEASVPDSNDGQLVTDGDRVLWTRAKIATALNGLADVDVVASPGTLPALSAGPTGILFQAHASNANAIRLGSDATTSRGMQLRAGQSVILSIDDASHMKAYPDSGGSGACVLIVSQA